MDRFLSQAANLSSQAATQLNRARQSVEEQTAHVVAKGRESRGGENAGGYQFGDFTRGLMQQAGVGGQVEEGPPPQYGFWGPDVLAEGEFGPPLYAMGYGEDPRLDEMWDSSSAKYNLPDGKPFTVYEVLKSCVQRYQNSPAVGTRKLIKVHSVDGAGGKKFEKLELANNYDFLTYRQYMERVTRFASGLVGLTGIPVKGRMVIYAETQQDWMVAALAAFSMGVEVVTIYATLGEDGARHGLNETAASVCVVDSKLLKVITKIAPDCHFLKHVITIAACDDAAKAALLEVGISSVSSFQDVLASSGLIEPRPPESPSDIAVIMYTSGTTGAPKGVLLSHSNLRAACEGFHHAASVAGVTSQDVFLAYLPLAHIMEMIAEIAILSMGASMGYGTPHTLIASGVKLKRPESEGDATMLKPTFMVFAPAVFDKVYKGVLAKVEGKGGVAKWIFEKALEAGMRSYDSGSIGVNPVLNLAFNEVQSALGGKIKYAVTGSAPLSPEIQRFMQTVLKAPVRQGYGLTENCACGTLGTKDNNAVKSVGGPLACTVIRLADWPDGGYRNSDKDNPAIGMPRGEVLVGGPGVCMGYLVNEQSPDPEIVKKNEEEFVTLAGIRYFRTGDIGQVCPNGTLEIIDRKKDLWKGPQGEYVALSKVEAALKLSPFVEIPMVYGRTGGDFPVAIICVVESAIRQRSGAAADVPATELCSRPEVLAEVMKSCLQVCKEQGLHDFETPKKIALLAPVEGAAAWTPDNDLLTAALKLKRPNIVKAFQREIDALYGAPA